MHPAFLEFVFMLFLGLYGLSKIVFIIILSFLLLISLTSFLNWLSYKYLKGRVVRSRKWDLNICCGETDGGGVNADIVRHAELPRFTLIENIYGLPFENDSFKKVLCSHTIEHVEDPERFHDELSRVGKHIVYLLPPLWDISAALNILEHRWIFWTMKTKHDTLPPYSRLPLAKTIQKWLGQRIKG